MEAMDLLLMACHAQTLNLFVESFLKMVQKLLEDSNPNLQIMATNSVSSKFILSDLERLINFIKSFSSSLNLPTLRKMRPRIIVAMTFSSQSSRQCVTAAMITWR